MSRRWRWGRAPEEPDVYSNDHPISRAPEERHVYSNDHAISRAPEERHGNGLPHDNRWALDGQAMPSRWGSIWVRDARL